MQTETIVATKNCTVCATEFTITDKDLEFYKKVSPSFNGEKIEIPTPTQCPKCRERRRLSFRNERKLYKRKCDFSGKEIISIYSPDKPHKVYDQKNWRSDQRDALEYGRDFDFSKTFSEQFNALFIEVPQSAFLNLRNENSEYNNFISDCKNCYYCYDIIDTEDTLYSTRIKKIQDCVDNFDIVQSNNSYQCIVGDNLRKCYFTYHCQDCNDSQFLIDCKNVQNSFFCSGLENKKYFLFNKQSTKEEIENIKQKLYTDNTFQKFYADYQEAVKKYNKEHNFIIRSEHCTGQSIFSSKNCLHCYDTQFCEDCKYCSVAYEMKDCYDTIIFNPECELVYGAVSGGYLKQSISCIANRECNYMLYCTYCFASSHCFGCVGLRNKEYCIFNKQYTKEEYNQLVPKIIRKMQEDGEWGEFFNPQLSPFGYNETVAMEYYPLSKEEALKLGFNRSDYEAPFPKVEKYVQGKKLRTASCKLIHEQKPELLEKLLNYAVVCEVSGKPFRITKQEIDFYIKHDLPLPRKHPDVRHQERLVLRGL